MLTFSQRKTFSLTRYNPLFPNVVANIGGKYPIPIGVFTVIWSWTDYEGGLQKNKLNNLIYFSDSPVNILSATALSESMKDYEVTWLLTKINILFLLGILVSTKRQYLTH